MPSWGSSRCGTSPRASPRRDAAQQLLAQRVGRRNGDAGPSDASTSGDGARRWRGERVPSGLPSRRSRSVNALMTSCASNARFRAPHLHLLEDARLDEPIHGLVRRLEGPRDEPGRALHREDRGTREGLDEEVDGGVPADPPNRLPPSVLYLSDGVLERHRVTHRAGRCAREQGDPVVRALDGLLRIGWTDVSSGHERVDAALGPGREDEGDGGKPGNGWYAIAPVTYRPPATRSPKALFAPHSFRHTHTEYRPAGTRGTSNATVTRYRSRGSASPMRSSPTVRASFGRWPNHSGCPPRTR